MNPARLVILLAAIVGAPTTAFGQSDDQAVKAAESRPETSVGPEYIIGPGDKLQVFVWRNPELSADVPVRPDGKISTPLVDDVVAVGKTPSELAREMESILGEYVRTPKVNVIVTEPASRFSQVKVVGQVLNPQSLAYRQGMKVLDAVLEAGGLAAFAAGNRARVIRQVDGKTVEIKVKLGDLLNKGRLETNVELRPGDVLVVPESYF